MSERHMRQLVLQLLRPLYGLPVENGAHDGCPDVVCVAGWIELKVAAVPGEVSRPVSVDLRSSQRVWLQKWRRHGGRAWTLVRLDGRKKPTWYLHDGEWASAHLGTVDENILRSKALWFFEGTPTSESLVSALLKELP